MSLIRAEENLDFEVGKTHVKEAVCQDKLRCTIALPLREVLHEVYGDDLVDESVGVTLHRGTVTHPEDAIVVGFDFWEGSRLRHATGEIHDKDTARFLLTSTDTDKDGLLRQLRGDKVFPLTLVYESRFKQQNNSSPLKYAHDAGYRYAKNPEVTAEVKAQREAVYEALSPEQQVQFNVGAAKGSVASEGSKQAKKRLPRRSDTSGRVFVS